MDKTYYPDKKKKKHSFNNISLSLISMFAKLSQMRVSMEKKNQHREDDLQMLFGLELPITRHSSCATQRPMQVSAKRRLVLLIPEPFVGASPACPLFFKCYICCCLKC